MNKLALTVVSGLSLLLSACSYNIAVNKASDRVYLNTSMKQVAVSAVQAVGAANLFIESSSSPVAGIVIISAKGGRNLLIQQEPATLTLTLSEIDPGRIRVDATAIQPGQTSDFGLTEGMVNSVFKVMDARHDAAGQVPHKL